MGYMDFSFRRQGEMPDHAADLQLKCNHHPNGGATHLPIAITCKNRKTNDRGKTDLSHDRR